MAKYFYIVFDNKTTVLNYAALFVSVSCFRIIVHIVALVYLARYVSLAHAMSERILSSLIYGRLNCRYLGTRQLVSSICISKLEQTSLLLTRIVDFLQVRFKVYFSLQSQSPFQNRKVLLKAVHGRTHSRLKKSISSHNCIHLDAIHFYLPGKYYQSNYSKENPKGFQLRHQIQLQIISTKRLFTNSPNSILWNK